MFDDPAQEVAELSAVIKQDITALNTAIAELQNHAARNASNKQGADHSVTVVDTLKTRLMGATKAFDPKP
jgi:syntaxin 5